MNAREFRIGNYVGQDINSWSKIVAILPNKIIADFKGLGGMMETHLPAEQMLPIPLTEEWLVKFGFKKVIDDARYNEWLVGKLCIEFDEKGCYFTGGECVYYSCNIKYIHQLQNLYFALTGEELTIK